MQKKPNPREYRVNTRKRHPAGHNPTRQEVINTVIKISRLNSSEENDNEAWRAREDKLVNDLENSFEIEYYDKKISTAAPVVGPQAISSYYNHYKHLNKIVDQNQFSKTKPSVFTSILTKCENLRILPSKLGVVKYNGDPQKILIPNSRFGGKYLEALSEGLRDMTVTACNFNSTRFNSFSGDSAIPAISKGLESLKLQNNSLNAKSILSFQRIFQAGSRLLELDLANNKLTDSGVISLCQTLQNNNRIRILNLSENNLTCKCTESLSNLFQSNNLEEVYLQWNKIEGVGGRNILEGVNHSESIRVLDVSWNLLGNSPQCMGVLEMLLKHNTELYHVDFSYNSFSKEECLLVSEWLVTNKTIYGFHFQGNYGYVDYWGFLRLSNNSPQEVDHCTTPLSLKTSQIHFLKSKPTFNSRISRNVCWLCQGWVEHEFTLELNQQEQKSVWLHLGFDEFQGIYIGKSNRRAVSYTCMIPPTKFEFFWTIEDEHVTSARYPSMVMKGNYLLRNIHFGKEVTDIFVETRNFYESPNKSPSMDLLPENVRPRETPSEGAITHSKQSILVSQCKKETEDEFRSRFQQEWKMIESRGVISEEDLEESKAILSDHFSTIRQLFKFYSCHTQVSSSEVMLNAHSVRVLFSDFEILDKEFTEQRLQEAIADMLNVTEAVSKEMDGITRPKFVELLCRVVGVKYEGIEFPQGLALLTEALVQNKLIYETHERWRDRVLYLQGLYKQTKKYNKRFQTLFGELTKHASIKDNLDYECVLRLFHDKPLSGQQLSLLQIKRACYYSKYVEDECVEGRITGYLNFGEFVECVTRLAFVDEKGDLVQENSLTSRRDRLQKMIDFLPTSLD